MSPGSSGRACRGSGAPAPATVRAAVAAGRRLAPCPRHAVVLSRRIGTAGRPRKRCEAGAPADSFMRAGARRMDELERKGRFVPGSPRVFARNILVAVKRAAWSLDLARPADLLDPRVKRI